MMMVRQINSIESTIESGQSASSSKCGEKRHLSAEQKRGSEGGGWMDGWMVEEGVGLKITLYRSNKI